MVHRRRVRKRTALAVMKKIFLKHIVIRDSDMNACLTAKCAHATTRIKISGYSCSVVPLAANFCKVPRHRVWHFSITQGRSGISEETDILPAGTMAEPGVLCFLT